MPCPYINTADKKEPGTSYAGQITGGTKLWWRYNLQPSINFVVKMSAAITSVACNANVCNSLRKLHCSQLVAQQHAAAAHNPTALLHQIQAVKILLGS